MNNNLSRNSSSINLITGLDFIDKKLGNLDSDTITTIYGPPGVGKTTLSFLYMNNCISSNKKVLYVDTEGGFSVERILQINPNINLEDISILRPTNFEEQGVIIKKLNKMVKKDVGLIVVDSLVMLYRLKLGDEPKKINTQLAEQLMLLSEISRKHSIPILITNQMYTIFDTNKERMVGGNVIEYWSKVIIKLKKENDIKKLILEKHKYKDSGNITNYKIVNSGFEKSRSFFVLSK